MDARTKGQKHLTDCESFNSFVESAISKLSWIAPYDKVHWAGSNNKGLIILDPRCFSQPE